MGQDKCSIALRVTEETKNALVDYAEKEDLSVSQVIRKAIKEFLQKNEEEGESNNG